MGLDDLYPGSGHGPKFHMTNRFLITVGYERTIRSRGNDVWLEGGHLALQPTYLKATSPFIGPPPPPPDTRSVTPTQTNPNKAQSTNVNGTT